MVESVGIKKFDLPGPHRLVAGPIEEGAVSALFGPGEADEVDAIWCDPPWGPRLLKWFYTHNEDRAALIDWQAFLSTFCSLCSQSCPTGPIYVAMGNEHVDDLSAYMHHHGVKEKARYTAYYQSSGGPRPCTIWAGSRNPYLEIPSVMPEEIVYGSGKNPPLDRVVKWCLLNHSDIETVMDPCCGKGQTAKVAIPLNLTFYGCELNEDRAAKTAEIVEKTVRRRNRSL